MPSWSTAEIERDLRCGFGGIGSGVKLAQAHGFYGRVGSSYGVVYL